MGLDQSGSRMARPTCGFSQGLEPNWRWQITSGHQDDGKDSQSDNQEARHVSGGAQGRDEISGEGSVHSTTSCGLGLQLIAIESN